MLADRFQLQDLNARYAHALDHNDLDGFLSVFAADAIYVLGPRVSTGHAELTQFFTGRQAAGRRVTRHFCSSFTATFQDADQATATSVWMSFVGNGDPPFPHAAPFMIADMNDRFVRHGDRWLIAERRIVPVFRSTQT
ncbi:MAG: nuclear transport factor 2 family protein [Pseudomonadota bacterium]